MNQISKASVSVEIFGGGRSVKENSAVVTVSVVTYNSGKYVIETLESIKNQTYPYIILQVSDDKSTDNTIELCRKWIIKNANRFVKSKIIVPERNTGISGNANRSWDYCESKYIKGIAGDDYLLPNCIQEYMDYMAQNKDSILVFSRPKTFGLSQKECNDYERDRFRYDFFTMSPEEQYEDLKVGSKLPAATAFIDLEAFRKLGIRHDERVPLLEDRPKWINAVWKGVRFDFLDRQLVAYRLRKDSLSNGTPSPRFYESTRLAYFYYAFEPKYKKNPDQAIRELVAYELDQYQQFYKETEFKRWWHKTSIYRYMRVLAKTILRR